MPQYGYMFSVYSYGFRPQRNTLQAVQKSLSHINSGYQHIVDIDLKGFFDGVDHCLLLNLVYRKTKCPVTMQLIRRWLRAPIWINGKLTKRRKGLPQGSPLSPRSFRHPPFTSFRESTTKEPLKNSNRHTLTAHQFPLHVGCCQHCGSE